MVLGSIDALPPDIPSFTMIPIRPIPSPASDSHAAPLTLGHEVIDHDHAEFVALVRTLQDCPDAEFATGFAALVQHVQAHFGRENALMETSGFPAIREHQGEHHRVIGELLQFKSRVDRGLIEFGRAYVRESAPPWFNLHLRTMDSALVAHLKRMSASAAGPV